MNIAIDQPWWLLLGLVGVLSGAISWHWMRGIPPFRRAVVVLMRVLLFVILAIAMSSVYWVQRADDIAVMAVVDVSDSVQSFADFGHDDLGLPITIDEAARGFLAAASAQRRDKDRLGIIAFNGQIKSIALPSQSDVLDRSLELQSIEGSDLIGAIRQARSQLPPDVNGRIVVFSDGRPTIGRLSDLSPDVPIDVVPIRYAVKEEVIVESVDLPARALPGSVVDVRVVIRSIGTSSGYLRLVYNGEVLDLNANEPGSDLAVSIQPGQQVIELPVQLGASRVHRIDAQYLPAKRASEQGDDSSDQRYVGDTTLRNNQASGVTLTSGHGRVLVVAENNRDGQPQSQPLVDALHDGGWDIETIVPGSFPTDLLDLEDFDLLVMVNTPRDALDLEADELLKAYVSDLGGGVIFIGGRDALGAGGWQKTKIEEIMPIKLDVADDLIMPPVAVVMVLDSSGSMRDRVMGSSKSKQRIANDSAASAIEMLDKQDIVGVVSFANTARRVVAIGPNSEPESTRARIGSISSNGGTYIVPALEMASDMLQSVEANSKHVVLLSDGESQNPERLPELAKQLGDLGIKVSTIAVGDEADEEGMRQIARRSGGKYYRVRNPSVLPRVFLKAIRVVRTPMVREGVISPIVIESDTPATGFIGQLPDLSGLVLSERISNDPRVSTPIVSSKGEPIFAFHQVELGRVSVFTSDVSRWANKWIESNVFARFWTNVFAWTMRDDQDEPGELQLVIAGSSAQIEYNAINPDGSPIDGLDVQVQLFDPSGQSRQVALVQVGSGRYEGVVDDLATGVHVVIASPMSDTQALPPTIAGLQINGVEEFKYLNANPQALVDLANRTGGQVYQLSDPASANLFDRTHLEERTSLQPIWTTLLIIAFALFVFDLAARRVAFDRWIAQARDETIAVSRGVRAEQIELLKASRSASQGKSSETPEMDRSPMAAAKNEQTPVVDEPIKSAESEESNPLLAAKRRARERMEED